MNSLFSSIVGLHWRTTLASIGQAIVGPLAVLAVLPQNPQYGALATFIPDAWKGKILTASLVSAFILQIVKGCVTADAAAVMTKPAGLIPAPQLTPTIVSLIVAALVLPTLALAGAAFLDHAPQLAKRRPYMFGEPIIIFRISPDLKSFRVPVHFRATPPELRIEWFHADDILA